MGWWVGPASVNYLEQNVSSFIEQEIYRGRDEKQSYMVQGIHTPDLPNTLAVKEIGY